MLLKLRSTATNERGPRYAQQAFANLRRCGFSLLVLPIEGKACLAIDCNDRDGHLIARELHAAYPDVALEQIPETTLRTSSKHRWRRRLTLHPHYLQLNTYDLFWNEADRSFTDPVASLLGAIAPRANLPVDGVIALDVKPCSWLRRWWFARRSIRKGLDPTKARHQLHRCRLTVTVTATHRNRRLARRRLQEILATFGQFVSGTGADFCMHRIRWPRFVLSDAELATIWHPTTVAVKAPTMETNDSRELEAPRNISSGKEEGSAVLGATEFRGEGKLFAIKRDDRRRHLAIIGKTGMGKRLKYASAHDLRRGCAQRLINAGVSAETLKLVMRHKDFSTTERFYGATRAAQSAAAEINEKLAATRTESTSERGAEAAPQLSAEELSKLKALLNSI